MRRQFARTARGLRNIFVRTGLLLRLHTLRGQMLAGFLSVMFLTLALVGFYTYESASRLLEQNAETLIRQAAVQGNGRLEATLKQIDSLTLQAATDAYVQNLLEAVEDGGFPSFLDRQALQPIVDRVMIYGSGIRSVELYTSEGDRLFPLGGDELFDAIGGEAVGGEYIVKAHALKGSMYWIGLSPTNEEEVLAIRQIQLIQRSFAPAGYLVVRIDRQVFRLDSLGEDMGVGAVTLLFDRDGRLIASNTENGLSGVDSGSLMAAEDRNVELDGRSYVLVKQQSEIAGWTLLILTPVEAITRGIFVLRAAVLVSAAVGSVLFIILSFLLSTAITRPILRLIKSMRSARFGELKPAEHMSATAEIGELVHTYNQMVDHMKRLIRLVYEKEIMQNRAELKALQAQIHPHFLYNTLEALYWSLIEKNEDELAEYVVALSELFRYTISGLNREEWVTLAEELEQVRRYLLIMGMRFGDRLKWSIHSEVDNHRLLLPKLIIQPLVENAIQHGIENKLGSGLVTVTVKRSPQPDCFRVIVEDDGAGMDGETLRKIREALEESGTGLERKTASGYGIANVHQRLRLYFGDDAANLNLLAIESRKGEGTTVTLTIPIRTEVVEHEPAYHPDRG
ncbi:sensor histidine kinase [Thermobacillus sp. ZCTH02-B1]|uniref:cache domain-containing sensor histidine kinase n=1 Tax=Thermobacillus sp. ZCTH02-B1 TaxID=1858795 RepID=UPI0025F1B2B8|nr:sensor histidine kinase [Thermobacillus sp. ZCTH02-B1]